MNAFQGGDIMIKVVFFDIGGTIHTQHPTPECDREYASMVQKFLQDHGIPCEDKDEMMKEINAGAKAYKKWSEETLEELPPDRIWSEFILPKSFAKAGSVTNLGEPLSFMYDRYRKVIEPREGMKETLKELKQRGYRLGVISNIMSIDFVPHMLEEYGITDYFEKVVLSSVCGIRKPRKEIFELALENMGIGKDEACYVGDTVSRDVLGTRNAGWALMLQIDNPLTHHKDAKYKDMRLQPDYLIHNLREVLPAIEEFNRSVQEGGTSE